MTTTHHRQLIRAPRRDVYRALLDPHLILRWRVPSEMTGRIHHFEAREGGAFRVSLTYSLPDGERGAGKTTEHTDTYGGTFRELVPDARVVEVLSFETTDPQLMGEMTITTTLSDVPEGTLLEATHEGLPPGLRPEDNELGWRESMERLAALLEQHERS